MVRSFPKTDRARRLSVFWAGLVFVVFYGSSAVGVDIHPEVKQKLIEQARWERTKQIILAARQSGMDAGRVMARLAAGAPDAEFGSRVPCILVEFSDNLWADGSVNTPVAHIDSMLFSEGVYPTGSMRDYYLENSYGIHDVEGEVVGPILLPEPYSYYVRSMMGISEDEPNSRTLAYDAIQAADSLIDFSRFDADGDGFVDGVMIAFAGHGFEESGDTTKIQSHRWELPSGKWLNLDGKTVKDYTIQPEEHGPYAGGGMNGVGVFCHEWGHILGLPDLYDMDFDSWGIGLWSIMGTGNYLNNSHTPAHFDPWCKTQLGWVNVDTVQANRVDQAILAFETSPDVFRLWTPDLAGPEYFLVCNRQRTGFDSYLPGSGLMILHIDDAKLNNNNEYVPGQGTTCLHYKVAVMQADGRYSLEDYENGNEGDAGDLYTDETAEFDDLTNPGSRSYCGLPRQTQVAVWNISPPGSAMTANLDVTFSRPLLLIQSYRFDDQDGDGDGVPDPGETVSFFLDTQNLWKSTTDIEITVSCSSPAVIFENDMSYIDFLGTGKTHTNHSDPVRFTVTAGSQPTIADFYISYESEGGAFTFAETLRVDLGPKQVLLVDDDAGYFRNWGWYYISTLESLGVPYAMHDKDAEGSPPAGSLMDYPIVLWYTGSIRYDSLLVHKDIEALQAYLDAGGRLFLTGQRIARELSQTADSLFLIDYLGARYEGNSYTPPFVTGVDGDPVGDGISLVIAGFGGAANQQYPDNLEPVPGASASFVYNPYSTGKIGAVTYATGRFRTVFWGFGFEAVTNEWPQYGVTREEVLSRVLEWLGKGVHLDVQPAELTFTVNQGGPLPEPQNLSILNCCGDTIWVLEHTASWLEVDPDSGMTPTTVEVSVTKIHFPAGDYSDTLIITSPGAADTVRVPVTLQVYGGSRASNEPNPFNPYEQKTMINLGVTERASVDVKIYDLAGELVRTLLSGCVVAGTMIPWDGGADNGPVVADGVYLCHIKTTTEDGIVREQVLKIAVWK